MRAKKSKKCACEKREALFGLPGDPIATWCGKCPQKHKDAVDIVSRLCVCGLSRPSLGMFGEKRAIWCKKCPEKHKDAINVVSRRCICGKSTNPMYALPEGKKALWCSICPDKPKNAKDIKTAKCICGKSKPNFGLPGDKRPTWCAICPEKPIGAEDIRNRKCVCGKSVPSFGLKDDDRPSWCKKCPGKPVGAENIKSRKCACGISQPNFGLPGDDRATWCFKCPDKAAGAENISRQRCVCGVSRPSFGIPGDTRPSWCSICPNKPARAENIISPRCVSEWCDIIVTRQTYKGYCLHCFVNIFPNETVSRNYKIKEKIVRDAVEGVLTENYQHLQFSFDKSVSGGCSRKRPDTFIDVLTHAVFGEVDEEGHNTSEYCSCENMRMMKLMVDVAYRPIVFVRFNPDAFTDAKGQRHKSCFKKTKTDKLIIADKKELDMRIRVYIDRIRYHLENVPEIEVQVEHLFYDGFAL